MGLCFIKNVLERWPNSVVHHLNRGNDYWNHEIQNTHKKYGDRINHLKCNRKKRTKFIKVIEGTAESIAEAASLNLKDDIIWDIVADFSCYIPSDMRTSMIAFRQIKLGTYVYISTDSVYEVTQAKYKETELSDDDSYETVDSVHSFDSYSSSSSSDSISYTIERRDDEELRSNPEYFTEDGLIKEGYGFHNKRNSRFRDYLSTMDAYGFEKLTAENILAQKCKDKHKYIILRLPDVIGPYDDSGRFWVLVIKMMALIQLKQSDSSKGKFDILKFKFDQEEESKHMSIVSSVDVSNLLQIIALNSYNQNEQFLACCNQIYNMTSQENLSLKSLHSIIFDNLVGKEAELSFDSFWERDESSKNTYPSVHCGPI